MSMASLTIELPDGDWCIHGNMRKCMFARYSKSHRVSCCVAFNKLLHQGKYPMKCPECKAYCKKEEAKKG